MHKRIIIIHRLAEISFSSSIALYLINDTLLKKKIPLEIVGYILFLNLGFYVGFHLALREVERERKKKADNFLN